MMKAMAFMLLGVLFFTSCSNKEIIYRGQVKSDWLHIYQEYEDAKRQRDETIGARGRLQKRCIQKIKKDRVAYSLSCTKQLQAFLYPAFPANCFPLFVRLEPLL